MKTNRRQKSSTREGDCALRRKRSPSGSSDRWQSANRSSRQLFSILQQSVEVQPAWSRDGTSLFFVTSRGGGFDIYRVHLGDGTVTPVVTGPRDQLSPAVSPDGTTLASASWDHTARVWPLTGAGAGGADHCRQPGRARERPREPRRRRCSLGARAETTGENRREQTVSNHHVEDRGGPRWRPLLACLCHSLYNE